MKMTIKVLINSNTPLTNISIKFESPILQMNIVDADDKNITNIIGRITDFM